MTPFSTARLVLALALGVLAGCQAGQNSLQGDGDPPADTTVATAKSVKLIDRDVEAPDVFQVADNALWDGRPSLGGIWVASPDAVNPERVIMRNPDNGKFVIGALFKRERDNPGPSLQISSDAAEALGMLAGQPAKITVTALRREEQAPAVSVDATRPILDAAETVQVENLSEGANTPAPQPIVTKTLPATQTPSQPNAAAAAPPATAPAPSQPAAPPPAPLAPAPLAPAPLAPAATSEPVTLVPLIPLAPAPATAAPQDAPPAATNAPAAPSAAAPLAQDSFIQIGVFSVEANAKGAVATLAGAGITATIRSETIGDKTQWVVRAPGDAAALARVKAAGFKDAYLTKG